MNDPRADAIEANIAGFLLSMGRAGGGDERADAEITWTSGGSPIAYHNAVVRCDAPPERADALIDAWLGELQRRGLPGSWHVAPWMQPGDLAARLIARGFEDAGEEPAMAADLSRDPPKVDAPDGLAIERVRDAGGMDAYRDVLGRSFGEGPHEAAWAASVFLRIGLGDDAPWRHYVALLDGAPVATASRFVTAVPGGTARSGGIYFVSTLPDARKRGIGAAITRHAMLEASALGCTLAVLGSSPMGHAVYRRLGFEDLFVYRMFEWAPRRVDA